MQQKGVLSGALAVAALVAVSVAFAGNLGNSPSAKSCQKDGWTGLYTRSGQAFSNGGACVSYAGGGGQLIVKAALACLNDGWKTLGSTSSQPFASEQACVDFANAGGTPVALGADLAVAKSVSDATPNVGDQVTFTVTLANGGPATATGVAVTDLLPAGLTFVSATPSQGSYSSVSGVWTVGTVMSGTPQTLTIQATVVSPSPQVNTATITHSDQFDPNPANNSASVGLLAEAADLAVAKSVSNPTPNVGDLVTFTVTLTNSGPDTATGVAVTDLLPAGLAFVSATPSQGSYDSATGVWTVGTVSLGTPQTLMMQATVVSPSPQVNTATISHSDQFDPNTANNTASSSTDPQTADLMVLKSVSDPTPNVGDLVTFTVTLTNSGPAVATGVQVIDLLPAGLAFVSATPSQGSYDSATGVWTVGTVSVGTPQTLVMQATVVSPSPQTNTATISHSDQFDPNTANNTASSGTAPQRADLMAVKSVSNTTPNVGDQVTFTVTLINSGPDAATGVAVTDQLPPGLAFVSATPSQGTYAPGTGLWTVGTVTSGTPQTLTILATVVSPSPQVNTASISHSDQFDPNPANNSASVGLLAEASDLAVAKSVSDPTPNVGDLVTFTVTLTNSGPDTATGVRVLDLLPAGLTFVSATPSQGTYTPTTGVWTVGTVTTGTPQTLTIQATVVSPSSQANTATITHSDQFDPNTANNSASSSTDPQAADLMVLKSVSDSTPNVGDQVTFTVTLTNSGAATATGVAVTDLLPAGLTFVSATPSQGTYTPTTGLWDVGTVSVGAPQTLTIQSTVVSPSPQVNTATISHSDQFDPNTANNTASSGTVPQRADLMAVKSVSDSTPNVGDQVTFTVTLINSGPDAATGVTVTDLLPAGLTFVSATPSQGSYDLVTGVWTVGTVTSGTPQTLTIQSTVVSPSLLVNTATISHSDQFDPNPANNSASVGLLAEASDLAVAKSVSNPTPNVGDQVTFTVTLTNSGPDAATGVAVTDLLPAGLAFVSATPSQGSYDSATGVWTVGTVSVGTPQTLTIQATVVSPSPTANTATISHSDQFDPNPANNTASSGTDPQAADLMVLKSVSDPTPNVGDQVTFTVTLTNSGPAVATGVAVTDLLPAGLTFVSATPSQGTYTPTIGVWDVGIVSVGTPQTLTIQATVVSPDPQTNTATITDADQFDPNSANNTASSSTDPQAADLMVAKSVSDPTPNVGDQVTFTVTLINSGPDAATGVTVTDLLPAGLTFVSATPSQGSYDPVTGVWTVGTATSGTPQTLMIQATVVSPDPQTNTATITHSDQFDPNPANNSASVGTSP